MKYIVILFIIAGFLSSCGEQPTKRESLIEKVRNESARRDTTYPYEWDTDHYDFISFNGGPIMLSESTIQFHEEYVDLDGMVIEGHWVNKHKFVLLDTTAFILVSRRTVTCQMAGQTTNYSK